MSTDTTPTIHIHRPASCDHREVLRCPRCKRARRCVVTSFIWYDPIVRCCNCGAAWGGCRYSKPTGRNVAAAVNRARELWAAAGTRAAARKWMWDQLETGLSPSELHMFTVTNTLGATSTYAARARLHAIDLAIRDGLVRNKAKATVTQTGPVPFPADRGGRVYQRPNDQVWVLTDRQGRTLTFQPETTAA